MKLPKTTITLSFLLVLLVIAGMYVKTKIENGTRAIADSLVKHPEQIQAVERGLKLQSEVDTTDWITEHSELKR